MILKSSLIFHEVTLRRSKREDNEMHTNAERLKESEERERERKPEQNLRGIGANCVRLFLGLPKSSCWASGQAVGTQH